MICRGDDAEQDERGVQDAHDQEKDARDGRALLVRAALRLLLQVFGRLGVAERLVLGNPLGREAAPLAQETALVHENAADAESVAEMHTRHRGELVHILAAHEDTGGVLGVDGVDETVLFRQQAWRHARVDSEGQESEHVEQRHGTAHGAESVVVRGDVIIVRDEAHGTRNVDQSVGAVEDGEEKSADVARSGALDEPFLHTPFYPACSVGRGGPNGPGLIFEQRNAVLLSVEPQAFSAAVPQG